MRTPWRKTDAPPAPASLPHGGSGAAAYLQCWAGLKEESAGAAAVLRRWLLDESGAVAAKAQLAGAVVLALLFICLLSNYIKKRGREAREQAAEKLRIERGERGSFFELSSTGDLAPHYDVVVIGSGYGAGCAALRFAQSTKKPALGESRRSLSVAVLERGRELLPGSFPETAEAALEHVQVTLHNKKDPADVADSRAPIEVGSRLALMDIRAFQDVIVVQGCGLGGTSLINANVVIEADQRIYDSDRWPEAILQDFQDNENAGRPMDQYFNRAREQIGAATYPDNWPRLSKLEALKYATKCVRNELGRPAPVVQGGQGHRHLLTWEKTPIAVSFEERAHTKTGFVQPPCNLCGNCCSGCNTGAKNTVNTNYIADAWAYGADIFTGMTVTRVEKAPERADGTHGYVVYYKPTDKLAEPDTWRAAGDRFVLADRVVLGAGSLGSTEILLRSAGKLPLSDRLGDHYSGNGDSFGAATGITRKVASFGNSVSTNAAQDNNFAVGPCITSVTKVVETGDIGDIEDLGGKLDFVVEDCSVPGALRGVSNIAVLGNSFIKAVRRAHSAQYDPSGIPGAVLNPARRLRPRVHRGPSDHIEPFLVMSHDDAITAGTMSLEGDDDGDEHLVVSWPNASQDRAYPHSAAMLKRLGAALEQDDFVGNPAIDALHRGISVHPLGGCCMGDNRDDGVVNHCGQVFDAGAANDTDLHEGLYCVDGSIVPTSLGINPLLTITALAERCMSMATREPDLTPGEEQVMLPAQFRRTPAGPVDPRLTEARTMLTFTERMAGSVERTLSSGTGTGDKTDLSFVLAVTFKSLEKLTTDPATLGKLSGTVSWGQRCLSVCSGDFRLFELDESVVAGRRMVYSFVMVTTANERYKFVGYKTMERRRYSSFLLPDLWAGITTLHTTITSEADPKKQWRGTLRTHPTDLLAQMGTLRAWRVGALIRRSTWTELFTFLSIFATQAWRVYWRLSSGERLKGPVAPVRMAGQQTLRYSSRAEDALLQPMQFYPSTAALSKPAPIVLLHGMAVSSEIFSLVTVDVNLVEHLTARGFDVYVPELRMSTAVPEVVSTQNGTFDLDTIATEDVPGAVADACAHFAKRHQLNEDDVRANVLGHCAGGAALAIALLHDGCTGTRARLRKVAFSQVSIFSEPAPGNSLKAALRLSSILSFAPLLLVLAVGATGAALCALARYYWYTAAQLVVLAAVAAGGSLGRWAVSRMCWRLGGIDPGSYHWPPFDWAASAWAWVLTRGSPQRCSQGCCHWITFLYGLLYQHDNLNHETHAAMPSLFGFGGMRLFAQLAASCRRRCVVPYSDSALSQAIARFVQTQVPLLLVHGAENRCWSAGGAHRTVATLREAAQVPGVNVDPDIYQVEDVAGYGHLDCIFGKAAAQDVFPRFSTFFE